MDNSAELFVDFGPGPLVWLDAKLSKICWSTLLEASLLNKVKLNVNINDFKTNQQLDQKKINSIMDKFQRHVFPIK